MTISGGRTQQLVLLQVFCRFTGFTGDFLSFIVVEHIRLFHGSLQLLNLIMGQRVTGTDPWPTWHPDLLTHLTHDPLSAVLLISMIPWVLWYIHLVIRINSPQRFLFDSNYEVYKLWKESKSGRPGSALIASLCNGHRGTCLPARSRRRQSKGFTGCQRKVKTSPLVGLVYNKISYANRSRVSIHLQWNLCVGRPTKLVGFMWPRPSSVEMRCSM